VFTSSYAIFLSLSSFCSGSIATLQCPPVSCETEGLLPVKIALREVESSTTAAHSFSSGYQLASLYICPAHWQTDNVCTVDRYVIRPCKQIEGLLYLCCVCTGYVDRETVVLIYLVKYSTKYRVVCVVVVVREYWACCLTAWVLLLLLCVFLDDLNNKYNTIQTKRALSISISCTSVHLSQDSYKIALLESSEYIYVYIYIHIFAEG